MLGLPDLLILDEPTNGLDPPQIREMREVLIRYAGDRPHRDRLQPPAVRGRADLHHLVVMHQGRLVAQGPVAEIVGSATALVVESTSRSGPRRWRRPWTARGMWRSIPSGITLKLVGTPRSELVRVLVADGLAVDRITPQRGLEEAFLALVGEA